MPVSAIPANLAKIGDLVLTILVEFMNGFFLYALIFVFIMGAIVEKSKIFGGGAAGKKSQEKKIGQLFGLAIAVLMARMYPLKVWASGWTLPILVGTIVGVIAYAALEKFLGEPPVGAGGAAAGAGGRPVP